MKKKKSIGMICIIVVLVVVVAILLFNLQSLNNSLKTAKTDLSQVQNELIATQEESTKLKQTVNDYQILYGDVKRSDIDQNINSDNADDSILLMSSNNPQIVVRRDGYSITIVNCSYTPENVTIDMDITNQSEQPIKVDLIDAYIENCSLPNMFDNSEFYIDVGNSVTSTNYFLATQLESNNLTEFNKLGCKLVVTGKDGTNLYSRDIVIMREVFN